MNFSLRSSRNLVCAAHENWSAQLTKSGLHSSRNLVAQLTKSSLHSSQKPVCITVIWVCTTFDWYTHDISFHCCQICSILSYAIRAARQTYLFFPSKDSRSSADLIVLSNFNFHIEGLSSAVWRLLVLYRNRHRHKGLLLHCGISIVLHCFAGVRRDVPVRCGSFSSNALGLAFWNVTVRTCSLSSDG